MTTKSKLSYYLRLLGPAFIAAVAYVDPGNFAANFSAGAKYGYMLVWVLVLANIMAALVQYLSAKVGLVTGQSLPEVVGTRLSKWPRIAYWAQAELVAIACDIAEIIGGAVALNILFGVPLVAGGLLTGVVSMVLLVIYRSRETRYFERLIMLLLCIIPIGFFMGLFMRPPEPSELASGLIPRFDGKESVLLATAMLGATIMPHVVYLHSALARDRHGKVQPTLLKKYLRATRFDVGFAMLFAGSVNISMIILAASALRGVDGADTLDGVYAGLTQSISPMVGTFFAIGLLISGFISTSIGSQAGAVIMDGLLKRRIPLVVRRLITLAPALIILVLGVDPTRALIISQIGLSFGVPFALIPLARITSNRLIMGSAVNSRLVTAIIYSIAGLVSMLNLVLIILTVAG
ncbi:Nramp family divalent metal transporter [Microbacteriaceae bacterium]|nr:Nramp family divalent metal transporter [Candidatus Saccharibacteria bacterium]